MLNLAAPLSGLVTIGPLGYVAIIFVIACFSVIIRNSRGKR